MISSEMGSKFHQDERVQMMRINTLSQCRISLSLCPSCLFTWRNGLERLPSVMRAVGSGTSQDITRYVLLTHYPRSVGFTSGGGGGWSSLPDDVQYWDQHSHGSGSVLNKMPRVNATTWSCDLYCNLKVIVLLTLYRTGAELS